MSKHLELSDMPKFCTQIKGWLDTRYGVSQGEKIWGEVCAQYNEYMKDLPDYGGKKNVHSLAIYGAVLIFSLYPKLPDHPPVEELQGFVQSMFMAPFEKLGKVINLNRSADMRLINYVFRKTGDKDRKQIKQYPNAEFAKKHGLMNVLPLLCNSDYWGIGCIHGTLIRKGTCGTADKCDYCVVGSENPLAQKYEIVKDEGGFLVSREKK